MNAVASKTKPPPLGSRQGVLTSGGKTEVNIQINKNFNKAEGGWLEQKGREAAESREAGQGLKGGGCALLSLNVSKENLKGSLSILGQCGRDNV